MLERQRKRGPRNPYFREKLDFRFFEGVNTKILNGKIVVKKCNRL